MTTLRSIVSGNGLLLAVLAALATFVMLYDHSRVQHGVAKERSRQEKIDADAHSKGAAAAAQSLDPGARGVLDPTTRSDG